MPADRNGLIRNEAGCSLERRLEVAWRLRVEQLPPEQNMQPPIAEAAALLGHRPHALAKAGIVSLGRPISHSAAGRWLYTPAVRSSHGHPPDERQLSASRR